MLTQTPDFMEIIASPNRAYSEGLRFFQGEGMLNDAMKTVANDLDSHGIDYVLIGAGALNRHGYLRFTSDIDIVLSAAGLESFKRELVGRGYRPAFEGSTRAFRLTDGNIPIEVLTTDDFPGDGKPKTVRFPDPSTEFEVIEGIHTASLKRLIEIKLASGLTGRGRLKDLADVQELIRIKGLLSEFAEHLDKSVRAKFLELREDLFGTSTEG